VLRTLGVAEGERVFALAPRIPGLYVAALGTLKSGAVFCPLFPAFGPEPIRTRMEIGEARALVTTAALYARKIAPLRAALPRLEHVLLADREPPPVEGPGVHALWPLLEAASPAFEACRTNPEDPALLHFTSGTTGAPKGAVHVHAAVIAHHVTGRYALDLHPDDVYWCTADPGWVTGTSYGIIAPLTNGVTMIVDEEEFDAPRWYAVLQDEAVTVWYTAPTAVRMLMKAGAELPKRYRLDALRFAASVGEPLNPEAVLWGRDALGLPFHDNWWQTETGGIMIANFASMDIKAGSMGKPIPGVEAAIVRRAENGDVEMAAEPGTPGELALKPGWPSMFRGYLGEDERYRKCFRSGWYLSGDLARRDRDGYYWFVGRGDDVIKSAGHLIALRQDHAPAAQGAGARAARGRHVDARAGAAAVSPGLDIPRAHALELLRGMLRIRRFEEKCAELYSATKIRGFLHLYIGEEAIAVGAMRALTPEDAVVATYREHGHALARGVPMERIMAEMYGKAEGCCRGRGGSMHLFDAATRFYGGNAIVAGGLPLAVGLALAAKLDGRREAA